MYIGNAVNTHSSSHFVFEEYDGLMRLVGSLDIHWYLYIILVFGNFILNTFYAYPLIAISKENLSA